MKLLAKSAYEKAITYLNQQARPLDRARYTFHFENGPAETVLSALDAYQNADGGFGHGLEPDVRLADSSVIATTIAFQHFREVNAPVGHPMIAKACQYLNATFDSTHVNWPIIPANVDDAPHAPWWTVDGDSPQSLSNPRAEIAGYLNDYPQHFPETLREQVTQAVLGYLHEQPDTMEMHDLYCYLRLWQSESLPHDVRATLFSKLKRIVDNTVERNPAGWAAYGLQPLSVISGPESPFIDGLREAVDHNLDFLIETQGEDGGWQPNWSWGDQWPEAWAQAKRDWSGGITLGNLRTLRAFGRIEV